MRHERWTRALPSTGSHPTSGPLPSVVMGTYLDEILAHHRALAAADPRPLDGLLAEARLVGGRRGFAATLVEHASSAGVALIAEVKRATPSLGAIAEADLDVVALARTYEAGGAAALSVLTDERFFSGSAADLVAARQATGLPVLRKDFVVSPADIADSVRMGADALLLIVAGLGEGELAELLSLSGDLGIDALVEVHDEHELERALAVGATLVGVNQRDLFTFGVDPDRAARLGRLLPPGVVGVAESGIRSRDDVRRLADAGFRAVLVGEALVTASDRSSAVAELARCS